MKKQTWMHYLLALLLSIVGPACGGASGENGSNEFESGDCVGGGYCGEQAITVQADIGNAEALFIQNSESSVLASVSPGKAITVSSESPLFSITTSGIINVLAAAYADNSDALSGLPKLSFVAVSPVGHVVLVFEYPFIFTDTAADGTAIADYSDPWSPSSPFTCQIFVVNKKIQNASSGDPLNLSCLTTELELNTWDFRAAMIQFDGDGGVYFSAHVPNNWKNVLLKWTPSEDDAATADVDESVSGSLAEVINANICFREFTVTNEGGVLYTGITSSGGNCDGTSFLRYKTPAGSLLEITSGWWEYVFQPIESTLFADANVAADITAANVGQILFYGPDPEIATTPDWDDACLFSFNPDESGDARSVKIADCDIDIWQYVDWAEDMATKKTRCVETKSMMGGGNIPQKILLADFNNDGAAYEIYVAGQIFEKKAGEWRCDLCTTEAAVANYCSANGNLHFEADVEGECIAVDDDGDSNTDGVWGNDSNCFNQQVNTAATENVCDTESADFRINGQWCQQPGGDWRDTYNALAWVIYDSNDTADESDDTRQIVRFSDNNEIVRNAWVIDNQLIYSSFIAEGDEGGTYKLRKVVFTDSNENGDVDTADGADDDNIPDEISKTDLLSDIEVYELFADPRSDHDGEWFFNGLRFSDNQYITGTFNPSAEDVGASLATEADITGQIETLVIVPSF